MLIFANELTANNKQTNNNTMRTILKTLGAALMLLLPLTGMAKDGVILELKDGSVLGFEFDSKPVLVTGEQITMRTGQTEVSYPYASVRNLHFGEVSGTGISGLKEDKKADVTFSFSDAAVECQGLPEGGSVAVYTTDGRQVAAAKVSNGAATVKLPTANGVYIVKTSTGVSYKISK